MDRLDQEFPLSYGPPPAQSQNSRISNSDLNVVAAEVRRLTQIISQHQTTHEQIRNRRERLSSILERFKELQHQPQHIRSAEMNQLEHEIDDVIFEQAVQYTSRNSRLNPRPKPRKPVRTVVPLLPVPAYREQHEAEFERSLEYVKAQITILEALEEHDTVLDPQTAYTWTLNIAPVGQMPEPLQALRLCYYMRSHGYDTYASIKRSDDPEYYECTLRLLLADPKSDQRGVGYDHLYWMQDCETGEIIFDPHKFLRSESPAANSERNPDLIITTDNNESFMAPPVAHAGVPRLRGGEAAEHYRYSLSIGEIGPTRAGEQRTIFQDIREIIEAIEAGLPQGSRDTHPRSSISSDNSDESTPITRCPEALVNMWSNTSRMLLSNFEHRNRFIPLRHSFSY